MDYSVRTLGVGAQYKGSTESVGFFLEGKGVKKAFIEYMTLGIF